MAKETKIQWCDSTVNPIMGCAGCELFPPRNETLTQIDAALAQAGFKIKSEPLLRQIITGYYERIPDPTLHHKKGITTTNIWHVRTEFVDKIRELHGTDAAEAAAGAIERAITCYAAKLHLNKGCSIKPKPDGTQRTPKAGYAPTFEEVTTFDDRVKEVAREPDLRGKDDPDRPWINGLPRLIFVSDMGDAFSRKSDFGFLKREVIEPIQSDDGRRHLWLWLTKQPARMAEFAAEIGGLPDNVCAMATVTGPETLDRIADLKRVKAKMRGLSLEPLWERIPPSELDLKGIDWVIGGGESGSTKWAREFPLEWAEELRDHCAANGVAFFLKQLGRNPTRNGEVIRLTDSHGGDWDEWDEALRVRAFPRSFHDYRADEEPVAPGLRRVRKGEMTPGEVEDFRRLDKVVAKAAKLYVDAAAALYEIKEGKLYRGQFKTFEDYCQSVHQISRSYAYKLINAGRVRAELSPIVHKLGLPMPDNEAQLRELARVSNPKEREEVLVAVADVVKEDTGGLSARTIRDHVEARRRNTASAAESEEADRPKSVVHPAADVVSNPPNVTATDSASGASRAENTVVDVEVVAPETDKIPDAAARDEARTPASLPNEWFGKKWLLAISEIRREALGQCRKEVILALSSQLRADIESTMQR